MSRSNDRKRRATDPSPTGRIKKPTAYKEDTRRVNPSQIYLDGESIDEGVDTSINPNLRSLSSQNQSDDDSNRQQYIMTEDQRNSSEPFKRTRGRQKIDIKFIEEKSRRFTTFSKRKGGIMKKAFELCTLTGTEIMVLVASETGHVYTFATPRLQPIVTTEAGKNLIQTCLQSECVLNSEMEQRMNQEGYEEPDMTFEVGERNLQLTAGWASNIYHDSAHKSSNNASNADYWQSGCPGDFRPNAVAAPNISNVNPVNSSPAARNVRQNTAQDWKSLEYRQGSHNVGITTTPTCSTAITSHLPTIPSSDRVHQVPSTTIRDIQRNQRQPSSHVTEDADGWVTTATVQTLQSNKAGGDN